MEDVVKSHNVFVFQFFQEAYFSQSRAWHSLNKNASIFNFRSTKKLHRLYFYYLIVIIQTNSFECYNFLRLFIFSLEYCPISTCKKTFHFQKTASSFIIFRALVSTGATGAIAPELFEGHNVKNIFLGNFLRKLLVKNFLAPELLES